MSETLIPVLNSKPSVKICMNLVVAAHSSFEFDIKGYKSFTADITTNHPLTALVIYGDSTELYRKNESVEYVTKTIAFDISLYSKLKIVGTSTYDDGHYWYGYNLNNLVIS